MISDANSAVPIQSSAPTEVQVTHELLNILFRQVASSSAGSIIAVALSIYMLWSHVPAFALFVWASVLCMVTFIRFLVVRSYWSIKPPADQLNKWSVTFTALTAVSGCVWGSMGLIFFSPNDIFVTVYVSLLLAGIISGGVAALSPYPPAYYALAVPAILPLAIRSLFYAGDLPSAVGALLIFMLIVNLTYSRNMTRTMRQSVLMRFENIDLIRQLTDQKELAENANRAKSHFLAAASHDLRQPTHALGLFVATLRALTLRPELKRADVENIAGRLQEALKNLGQLLNALLDVSRLDAGVVAADKRPIALQDTLNSLFHEFSGPARSNGLELTIVSTSLWVDTDAIMMHRVLSNLLSNAVRYSHRGRILIGCRRRPGAVEIQIWDTGIGIAQNQLPHIFQEFYQVHNVARDREQGLGLGLAIVQRLVTILGAKLKVTSVLGKGSMFSVALPTIAATSVSLEPVKPVPDAPQLSRTVLVIDDDRQILDAVDQLLSAWGHSVVSAATLEQGVAAAIEHGADIGLIVVDYRLAEDVNGADAIRAVTQQLGRNVPAVIITGDTSPERIREASDSGFMLLHKPLDPEALRQVLDAS